MRDREFGAVFLVFGITLVIVLSLATPWDDSAVVGVGSVGVLAALGIAAGVNLGRRREVEVHTTPAQRRSLLPALGLFVLVGALLFLLASAVDGELDSSLDFGRVVAWVEGGALIFLALMYLVAATLPREAGSSDSHQTRHRV